MDIRRLLPKNQYDAAISATLPTTANPFATLADIPAPTGDGIYTGSGTTPPLTNVTITDSLDFGAGLLKIDKTVNRLLINNPTTLDSTVAINNSGTAFHSKILTLQNTSGFEVFNFYNSGNFTVKDSTNTSRLLLSTTGGYFESRQNIRVGTGFGYGLNGSNSDGLISAGQFTAGLKANNQINLVTIGGKVAIGENISLSYHSSNPIIPATLLVQGEGNTSATILTRFDSEDKTPRFIQNDIGQIGTGANKTASISTSFGQYHQTSGQAYGVAFYGENHSTAAVVVAPTGTTKWGLYVTNQGTYTGEAVMIYGNAISTVTSTNVGIRGNARNGSAYAIGLDGAIVGGASVTSSVYVAGVRGINGSNVHVKGYGGYCLSQQANGMLYTKDIVGTYGKASENAIANLSTGKVIGGQFLTSTSGGGTTLTTHMAINVPLTGNDGVVVLGADLAAGNSMLQVTGDIQIIGNSNGQILPDRLGSGARVREYAEKDAVTGVWSTYLEEVV